ncbi:MAG TPA: hypothetical protein VG164_07060 [Trebonia sp.]|jgi:hypothetical protein|nr:hypothetical protein [Trebonia sp.]
MFSVLVSLVSAATVLVALCALAASGFRSGDRPGDARVTVALADAGQPDESRPVVACRVGNGSGAAVLAGLTVRRARLADRWPGGGFSVRVPRRTGRRRFRATAHDTVGVVPAGAEVCFTVPVPRVARGYVLAAVVGQRDGRLRVYRLRVRGGQQPGTVLGAPRDLSGGTRRGR